MRIKNTNIDNFNVYQNLRSQPDPVIKVYYDFRTHRAGPYVFDVSGNYNRGEVFGLLGYDNSNGGGCVFGENKWVSLDYTLPTNFTVFLIGKFPSADNNPWNTLWGTDSWDQDQGYIGVLTAPNTVQFGPAGYTYFDTNSATATINNQDDVNIYTFVKNNDSYYIYINGTLQGSSTNTGAASSDSGLPLYIGARHTNYGDDTAINFATGTIYDFRLLEYAMTGPAVAIAFNELKTRYGL